MNGYIIRLDRLGFGMDYELSIDLILAGLPNSFSQFVLNYRMNDKETTKPELINLLKKVEPIENEGKAVMLVDFFCSKKSSKNKKKRNPLKHKEVWSRRTQDRQPQKVPASIVARMAIGRETRRPIRSQ